MLFSQLRSSITTLLTIIVAALVGSPRIVFSYEIAPLKNVHETLTLTASECLRASPMDAPPKICSQLPKTGRTKAALESRDLGLNDLELGVVTAEELMLAVRWPDDPTGEVASRTILKFLVKMWVGRCKKYNNGIKDGLLCNSHYGSLQFWHAMASCPEETTKETHRKMLAWAEFLYQVAVGKVLLTEDYCNYWGALRNTEGKSELVKALAPENQFPCPKDGEPWMISTLFDMTCRKPFSSGDCDVSLDPRIVRIRAIGALLHMIQDSYAQGHAARGSCAINPETGRITSKYECLPISQFYTYSAQDEKKHNRADKHPQPGRFCGRASTVVHDPVLASANVLWLVQQKKGATELDNYLRAHVFPLAADYQPRASGGKGFAKGRTQVKPCPF